MPSPRSLRLALALAALFPVACSTSGPRSAPRAATAIPAAPAATDNNALPRWRESFPALLEQVHRLDTGLSAIESPDEPIPELPAEPFREIAGLLPAFSLRPGEILRFDRIHGPETAFPDHHPLRQLASVRTVLARRLIATGDIHGALELVGENLALARSVLAAQEGIIPLINANGIWQSALDGVHALARSPALAPSEARALLAALQNDSSLASAACIRALRGEFEYVYRVIVDRMPETDDPDLFLSSVASLGMAPPEPLEPGELGLGLVPGHVLLDREATLRAYEADLAPYLAALSKEARLPRGLYERGTAATLSAYHSELGRFLVYANGELPPTLADTTLARADLLAAQNPGGKLLAVYLTPPWPVLISSTLRREAQRSALLGLLAWRIHGTPTSWESLAAASILPAAPSDPFSDGALLASASSEPRVWSVFLDQQDNGGVLVPGNTGQPEDLVWLY